MKKRQLPGEAVLLLGITLNSFASMMLTKSELGMSVTSAVPYIISQRFSFPSYGMWSFMVQCLWILVLIAVFKKIKPSYVLSFGLALLFGVLIDFWAWLLAPLPDALMFRILWFVIAYAALSMGIGLLMRCGLPIIPFDMVAREFVLERGISIRTARTVYDLTNLVIGLTLGFTLHGKVIAIGPSSIFCALFVGTGAGFMASVYDRLWIIRPRLEALRVLV